MEEAIFTFSFPAHPAHLACPTVSGITAISLRYHDILTDPK
jgi:hypothetical protein